MLFVASHLKYNIRNNMTSLVIGAGEVLGSDRTVRTCSECIATLQVHECFRNYGQSGRTSDVLFERRLQQTVLHFSAHPAERRAAMMCKWSSW